MYIKFHESRISALVFVRNQSINRLNLFVEDVDEKQLQGHIQKEKYLDNKVVHNLKKIISTGDSEVTG